MNPIKIRLANCRSFRQVDWEIPASLTAIIGDNGSGKSTLISAIDVALFGPEGRSLAPWYPRGIGEDPLTIELVFEHAGESYRVRRTFSPKGRGLSKLEFERHVFSGANAPSDAPGGWDTQTLESQTATQELIEATIGLSRATFRASSYLAQGDSGAFCDAQPRERKAILSEVVGLAQWGVWLERARTGKRACELEVAEKRALLDRAETELADRPFLEASQAGMADEEQQLRVDLEEVLLRLTGARESLAGAQQRQARRSAAERAHGAAEAALDDLRGRIGQREAEVAKLDERLDARIALTTRAGTLRPLQEEQAALQDALATWQERERVAAEVLRFERKAAQEEQLGLAAMQAAERVLDHVGEEHCDRCGQVLGEEAARSAAESHRKEAADHLRARDEAQASIEPLRRKLDATPSEEPHAERLALLYTSIRQAQEASVQLAALEEAAARRTSAALELDAMRAELPTREGVAAVALADVEALGPHDALGSDRELMEVQRLERGEAEVRSKLETALAQLARCSDRLTRLAELAAEADETRAGVEATLANLEQLTAMERACGPNGIPALILESVAIPQVEAEASRLLRVLGGPATGVELRTLRETKTGGISDTLDIMLMTETGEAPYESFSGGERARIAFALRLAMAQLLSGRKGSDTGLLIVDEVEGLDGQGKAALVGVLEEMQRSVPRIIVVSHDAELRDAFPQSLVVAKINGRSQFVDAALPATPLEVS